ncbi:MAG: hypothetical protein WBA93_32505 [Microcoleaceae cyanobacterium]
MLEQLTETLVWASRRQGFPIPANEAKIILQEIHTWSQHSNSFVLLYCHTDSESYNQYQVNHNITRTNLATIAGYQPMMICCGQQPPFIGIPTCWMKIAFTDNAQLYTLVKPGCL